MFLSLPLHQDGGPSTCLPKQGFYWSISCKPFIFGWHSDAVPRTTVSSSAPCGFPVACSIILQGQMPSPKTSPTCRRYCWTLVMGIFHTMVVKVDVLISDEFLPVGSHGGTGNGLQQYLLLFICQQDRHNGAVDCTSLSSPWLNHRSTHKLTLMLWLSRPAATTGAATWTSWMSFWAEFLVPIYLLYLSFPTCWLLGKCSCQEDLMLIPFLSLPFSSLPPYLAHVCRGWDSRFYYLHYTGNYRAIQPLGIAKPFVINAMLHNMTVQQQLSLTCLGKRGGPLG